MTYEEQPPGDNLLWRVLRIVVPWIALIIVVTVLISIVSDYRRATTSEGTSTGTVEATSTTGVGAGEPYVLVLSDGLNLRTEPSTSSSVATVLSKDEQLAYVSEVAGWYQVRRADGTQGWVAAGGRYTELVKP